MINHKDRLVGAKIILQALDPIRNPDKCSVCLGSATLSIVDEVSVDFAKSISTLTILENQIVQLDIILSDYGSVPSPDEEMDLNAGMLNYDFLSTHYADTVITKLFVDVYTDLMEGWVPICLSSLVFIFENDCILDYTKKVSVFTLRDLATVA